MQSEDEQLQVLTLLKHGLETYGDVLSAAETEVMTAVFDWVVQAANTVVGTTPDWFVSTQGE